MAAAPADAFARLAVLGLEIDEPALAGRVAALRLSGQDAGDVLGLARTVRRVVGAGAAASWSDEGVRRLAADAGRHLAEALDLVAAVGLDVGGIRVVVDRLAAVGELDDLGPALDGAAVMGLLGLREGREVGEAMAWLTDLRLRAGLLDAGEVADRLSAWWAER
jgi:poly(A) polymerase